MQDDPAAERLHAVLQAGRAGASGQAGAKNDLREGLGPEFADLEIEDLNPRRFVREHLIGDLNADQGAREQPGGR